MSEFKVGGYVVAKREFAHDYLYQFCSVDKDGNIYIQSGSYVLINNAEYFEVATPEEIKAGKRLP